MKDIEIRNLAQRFGITDLLTSKHQTEQFFNFVREVQKQTLEQQPPKLTEDGTPKVIAFLKQMDETLTTLGYTHEQRLEIGRVLMTTKVE